MPKSKKKGKAVPRAKCARNTTRTESVALPGGYFAVVRHCTSKRGKVIVKGKRFTRSPVKVKGVKGKRVEKVPVIFFSKKEKDSKRGRRVMSEFYPAGRAPVDTYFDPMEHTANREFEPAYYGD